MKDKYMMGRILAGFISIYHICLGFLMIVSGELTLKLVSVFGGMTITGSPELGIIGEILGCYLIAFGFLMGVAAWDPIKNRAAISIGLILIVLRIFQRIYFSEKVMSVFQIPSGRYWMALGIVTFLGVGLGIFRWKIYKDMKGQQQAV